MSLAQRLIFPSLLMVTLMTISYSPAQAAVWTGPTATPPAANKEEPINVGTTPQSKEGYLLLRNTTGSNNFSIQDIGQSNTLNFRINSTGSGLSRDWVLPNSLGSTGQALVVSSVAGNTMNLSWSSAGMTNGSAAGATWYWNGSAWINSTSLFNDGTNVGIGVINPTFKLEVSGNVGPNLNGLLDLGSNTRRWRDVYATNFIGSFNPGFSNGSVIFQSLSGLAQDNANFFWDNGNDNLGLGTASPNSRLHVYQISGANAEIDIQSNFGSQNHWGIYNDRLEGTDELRFWKNGSNRFAFGPNGIMTAGTVPWARLPAVASCSGATPVVTGFNSSGPICGAATLASGSAAGATLYYDGSVWQNSTNLFNNNGNIGIGVSSPADFKLQINGNTGPNTDNTYNLGSVAKRWANLYATNINVSGSFNPGLTLGSIYFQGPSSMTHDNANLFWDDTNNRLGLGTNAPANFLLDANGSVGPHADNSFNLGSASRRWANLYATNIYSTPGGLNLGVSNSAIVFGSASGTLDYDNTFVYDKANSRLIVGNTSNTAAAISARGNIYPHTDNNFDLGSSALQWRNIYTANLSLGGFTTGSVIFQGASGSLSQNNDNFFWDNNNKRLGLGTAYPLDSLQVQSDWYAFPSNICRLSISNSSVTVSGIGMNGNVCWFAHDLAVGTEIKNTTNNEYRTVTKIINNNTLEVDRPWSTTQDPVIFALRSRNLGVTEAGFSSFGGGLMDTYTNTPIDGGGIIKLAGKLFLHNSGWNDTIYSGGLSNTIWFSNTFLGENAGADFAVNGDSPSAQFNTAIGFEALKNIDPSAGWGANTAIGAQSMSTNSGTTQYNTAIGSRSLYEGAGSNNVALGFEALGFGASTAGSNVALGFNAGRNSAGGQNTYIGTSAGASNAGGSGNIFIGYQAGMSAVSGSDRLVINNTDNNEYSSLLYGKFDNGANPQANAFLRLNGRLQFGFGTDYRVGRTNTAGNGLCINMSANNNLQLFLINGAIICSRVVAAANCAGSDFTACCNAQGGCQ